MPSQVPAGFTRGSIMFIGAMSDAQSEARLLQKFWNEAGAFGARLLIIPAGGECKDNACRYQEMFQEWETESVTQLTFSSRQDAMKPEQGALVENATGILILGDNPLRLASTIGGTPLAQAIRKANARGKVVCGVGAAAAILCQHMIAFDNRPNMPHPFLHRRLIQFAPGLGLVNRMLLYNSSDPNEGLAIRLSRLLTAVAYNPFLVGVSLEVDTGVVIYPDTTLEIFGQNSALLVDGEKISYTDVHEYEEEGPMSILGAQIHVLARDYTFNFDTRQVAPPLPSDIPAPTDQAKITF
jgi:cyanophycinase